MKKINKNKTSNKPIKLEKENIFNNKTNNKRKSSINKTNSKIIVRRNIDNNLDINPSFLTYIERKTSLECLDNFLKEKKKQKK